MESRMEEQTKQTALFKNRNFLMLFISTIFSAPGYYVLLITSEWLMLSLSDNRVYFGLLFIAAAIPRLLFMLVGGVVADRFNKRKLLFILDITRALLIVCLLYFVVTATVTVWHLIALAAIFGVADAFSYPVTSSLMPTILGEEQLQKGNSMIQLSSLLSPIFGAALGGTLIAIKGFTGAYMFAAIMLFLAAMVVLFMRVKKEKQASKETPWEDLKAGFRYVRSNELIVSIVGMALVLNLFFTGPFAMGLPIIVKDVFLGDALHLAIMESMLGIGALIGALVLISIKVKKPGITIIASLVGIGIIKMIIGFSSYFYLSVGVVAIAAFLMQLINIPLITTLQKQTEKKMLGRMMSFLMLVSAGFVPISYMLTSLFISMGVSIQVIMIGAGGLVTLLALYNLKNKKLIQMTY